MNNDYYNQPYIPNLPQYKPKSQSQYDPYTQRFKDKYPIKYVIIHSSLIIVLSLAAIAIQVVLIVEKAPLSVLGSGIWIGVFYIVAVFLALLNSKLKIFEPSIL
jgi:hypothetical protein